eukprot:6565196-Pyramimonas_sp.AAC.1
MPRGGNPSERPEKCALLAFLGPPACTDAAEYSPSWRRPVGAALRPRLPQSQRPAECCSPGPPVPSCGPIP